MQRRAAAVYFAFFLAIAAGSVGYITVVDAQRPEIDVEGQEISDGEPIRIGDRTYVPSISEGSGELAWTNRSAQASASLENNSTTAYNNQSWTVRIENRTDVSEFDLREQLNVSAILAADSAVENETVTFEGERQVVYRENDSLRPLDEYLPQPETRTFTEGETFPYVTEDDGQVDATIANVTTSAVELTWETTQQNTISLSEGGNVTIDGTQYIVHFPDNSTAILSEDVDGYLEDTNRQDYFTERVSGLWGVFIVSFLSAIVLLGAAYLPVKD